jgi:uncharacterized protein YrzB (UPF0473 family)
MSLGSVADAFALSCLPDTDCVGGAGFTCAGGGAAYGSCTGEQDEDGDTYQKPRSNRADFKATGRPKKEMMDYQARIRFKQIGRTATYKNYYEVLKVDPEATIGQIKKTFVRKALKLHPDRRVNKGPITKEQEEEWESVSKAYQVLSNEEDRAKYDENMPLRNALVMFYQRHNTSQLNSDKIERTVRAYANDPAFLFRYLNTIYTVSAYTNASVQIADNSLIVNETKLGAAYQKSVLMREMRHHCSSSFLESVYTVQRMWRCAAARRRWQVLHKARVVVRRNAVERRNMMRQMVGTRERGSMAFVFGKWHRITCESRMQEYEDARLCFMATQDAKATQIANAWRSKVAVGVRQDAEAARIENCGVKACKLNGVGETFLSLFSPAENALAKRNRKEKLAEQVVNARNRLPGKKQEPGGIQALFQDCIRGEPDCSREPTPRTAPKEHPNTERFRYGQRGKVEPPSRRKEGTIERIELRGGRIASEEIPVRGVNSSQHHDRDSIQHHDRDSIQHHGRDSIQHHGRDSIQHHGRDSIQHHGRDSIQHHGGSNQGGYSSGVYNQNVRHGPESIYHGQDDRTPMPNDQRLGSSWLGPSYGMPAHNQALAPSLAVSAVPSPSATMVLRAPSPSATMAFRATGKHSPWGYALPREHPQISRMRPVIQQCSSHTAPVHGEHVFSRVQHIENQCTPRTHVVLSPETQQVHQQRSRRQLASPHTHDEQRHFYM